VEGSLFLVKRRDMPRFRLLVLNRNSNDNYQVDITPSFQVQEKEPYLMFRKPDGSIQGIWFHNGSERQQVATLLQKVVQSLAVDPDAAAAALLSPLTIIHHNGNSRTQQQQQPPTPPPPVHRPSPTPPQGQHSALGGGGVAESPVLDKKSLQLALLSLLHDERFLDLIHAQYLKVAHARANKSKSNTNNNNNNNNNDS
jgi:mRNA-decapping enzyme 1B